MHAFTAPEAHPAAGPVRTASAATRTRREVADAIIINSESLRAEVERYLDVDPAKLRLIPEAVDHELFQPGDADEARAELGRRYGVTGRSCSSSPRCGRTRTARGCCGPSRAPAPTSAATSWWSSARAATPTYVAELHALAEELGIADDVVWVGGVPLEETAHFYRAADVFVYPSFNETFGLPHARGDGLRCPVVTSDRSAMPETAGGAALLADPARPRVDRARHRRGLRPRRASSCAGSGPSGPREFSWAAHRGSDARGLPRGARGQGRRRR